MLTVEVLCGREVGKCMELRKLLHRLCVNYPDAQQEIDEITGEIYDAYFDLAYGVTPALFVLWRTEDDEFLTRVRLICA